MKPLNSVFLKKIIARLNKKNNICINVFCYENNSVYPVYVPNEKCYGLYGFIDGSRPK